MDHNRGRHGTSDRPHHAEYDQRLNLDFLDGSNSSRVTRREPGNSVSDVNDVPKGVELTPTLTSACSTSTDGRRRG